MDFREDFVSPTEEQIKEQKRMQWEPFTDEDKKELIKKLKELNFNFFQRIYYSSKIKILTSKRIAKVSHKSMTFDKIFYDRHKSVKVPEKVWHKYSTGDEIIIYRGSNEYFVF